MQALSAEAGAVPGTHHPNRQRLQTQQAQAVLRNASERLAEIVEAAAAGEPALQILSLVDGLSVQAATRGTLDYTAVRAMVIATAERLLALPSGTLAPVMGG
jgi:hypothetical protein